MSNATGNRPHTPIAPLWQSRSNRLLKSIREFLSRGKASGGLPSDLKEATLLITHAEVCDRHGTGALLKKIFANRPGVIVLYSRNYFGGNAVGDRAYHLPHPTHDPVQAEAALRPLLQSVNVSRIFCVPFYPDDVVSALAARRLTGAPLVLFIMDDQNVFVSEIPDVLMRPLIEQASLRFAISRTLQEVYSEKYKAPFWFIPPLASAEYRPKEVIPAPGRNPPRGVLIGNVWNNEILQQLRSTLNASGLCIDWYGNAGKPFIDLDPNELQGEGITLHSLVPEDELVSALRTFDYGLIPSGVLTGKSEHDWLFRASLPSRLIYLLATAHLPLIVLGDPETAAGQFVRELQVGETSPYEANYFQETVRRVTEPAMAGAIRQRAADMAPIFASEPVLDWIWQSLPSGRPIDDRYERIWKTAKKKTDPVSDKIG